MRSDSDLVTTLARRCTFPPAGTPLACAFSGGADSTALLVLALEAGCAPVAHHVDHGLRPESATEAEHAGLIANQLAIPFVLHCVDVADGSNLEARARAARRSVLPSPCATGHTLDDQAETLLVNLLRGTGLNGLAGMSPSVSKPLLALRRFETSELCATLGLDVSTDPSNTDRRHRRNRIRHELLPLLDDIAGRDIAPLIARLADLARSDAAYLDEVATDVDPTDAIAVAAAHPAIARRALRAWLTAGGYPPDAASVERVLDVANGEHVACELPGGLRVERTGKRLRRVGRAAY